MEYKGVLVKNEDDSSWTDTDWQEAAVGVKDETEMMQVKEEQEDCEEDLNDLPSQDYWELCQPSPFLEKEYLGPSSPKPFTRVKNQRITFYQKEKLLKLVEKDPRVLKTFKGPQYRAEKTKWWEAASVQLNSVPGAQRTGREWERCMADLAVYVKNKAKCLKTDDYSSLGETDQRLLQLICGGEAAGGNKQIPDPVTSNTQRTIPSDSPKLPIASLVQITSSISSTRPLFLVSPIPSTLPSCPSQPPENPTSTPPNRVSPLSDVPTKQKEVSKLQKDSRLSTVKIQKRAAKRKYGGFSSGKKSIYKVKIQLEKTNACLEAITRAFSNFDETISVLASAAERQAVAAEKQAEAFQTIASLMMDRLNQNR